MAAVLKAQEKFSFDELTQNLFHDLVEQAADDTHTCNAITFRAEHAKYNVLIDQLVDSGFIVHDKEQNSYRLYTPFMRVLESVFVSTVLEDLNCLLEEIREISSTSEGESCDIYRLSAQSTIKPDRVASLSYILYWLGLILSPADATENGRYITASDAAFRFNDVENCMDHLLQIFDVSKNTPYGQPEESPLSHCHYSTPMLALLQETMESYFSGRAPNRQPDKQALIAMLREKSVNGKKVSKKMAEAIYEILHAPD